MLSFFYLVFDMTSSCHPNKATYQDCGHQSMLSYLLSMLHQSLLAAPTTSRTRSVSNQTILTTNLCSRHPRPIADIITPSKGAPEVDPASTTCRYAPAVLGLNYATPPSHTPHGEPHHSIKQVGSDAPSLHPSQPQLYCTRCPASGIWHSAQMISQ